MSYIFKIMVIGDIAVGKTSLIRRYVENIFKEEYMSTIGVEFLQKKVLIDNKYPVTLVLWDVAGHSKFATFKSTYYSGSDFIIIVFDITKQRSYRSIERWLSEAQRILGNKIPFVIVGNKADLENERQITNYDDYKEVPTVVEIVETSAKTGKNVDWMFEKMARFLLKEKGFIQRK
jgi:small GTP-binding protein